MFTEILRAVQPYSAATDHSELVTVIIAPVLAAPRSLVFAKIEACDI